MTLRQFERLKAKALRLNAELKAVRDLIAEHAPKFAAPKEQKDGTSYNLGGVRVVYPKPRLVPVFGDPELVARLRNLSGDKFDWLFLPRFTCRPKFREAAYEHLPDKETAEAVIKLVEEPSKPGVHFS